jgi:exodeoxyribonuclease VII small subunit
MRETQSITFEAGYTRLQEIAERLNSDEVPVHEMCELFSEGKGLEQALTRYLDEQKSTVEAIDRGEGIRAFRIVAPEPDGDGDVDFGDDDGDASAGSSGCFTPQSSGRGPNDDTPF